MPASTLRAAVDTLHRQLPPVAAALYPIRKPATAGAPALWLLPAGWRGGDRFQPYVQQVQAFDWADFYAACHGAAYFEWLREQLLALADVVLIDSRTGVTEMGGVCARQMADVVISFSAPNEQNLAGVRQMGDSFQGEKTSAARREIGRQPVGVVVVPARLDLSAETDDLNHFEQRLQKRGGPGTTGVCAGKDRVLESQDPVHYEICLQRKDYGRPCRPIGGDRGRL